MRRPSFRVEEKQVVKAGPAVELDLPLHEPEIRLSHPKPGQETTLTMDYMMHAGMDGPHRFDVHVRTNDPLEPEKLLVAKSDWGP